MPLQALLSRNINGRGMVQVDREKAAAVWYALRGGWHYHVARTGVVSVQAKKNIHSHPGDALGYGASILFPVGKVMTTQRGLLVPDHEAAYFSKGRNEFSIGPGTPRILPKHGAELGVN